MGIRFVGGREDQICDHSANTHGLSPWRDEPVAEGKRAKAAGISSMAFREIGGKPHFGSMHVVYETGRVGRGYGFVPFSLQ